MLNKLGLITLVFYIALPAYPVGAFENTPNETGKFAWEQLGPEGQAIQAEMTRIAAGLEPGKADPSATQVNEAGPRDKFSAQASHQYPGHCSGDCSQCSLAEKKAFNKAKVKCLDAGFSKSDQYAMVIINESRADESGYPYQPYCEVKVWVKCSALVGGVPIEAPSSPRLRQSPTPTTSLPPTSPPLPSKQEAFCRGREYNPHRGTCRDPFYGEIYVPGHPFFGSYLGPDWVPGPPQWIPFTPFVLPDPPK